ncbi:hypothetical protein Mterra_02442 [Calidithermus terrae]|uniref:Uncharacterized protein n=1 Tax=Calidithermus terrae TaxID=1408545 RepID=A0A399EEB7_9DEIN|nr:hypothetical protein Mterra_02442 [Calidithermus terrae]
MCWPWPLRSRSSSAASTALAPVMPVMRSTQATGTRTGGPSGSPVTDMMPMSPWIATS